MNTHASVMERRSEALDLLGFVTVGLLLKFLLTGWSERFAGPISLVLMVALIALYLRRRGRDWRSIGLVRLRWLKGWLLLVPQTAVAAVLILATGILVGMGGEALGLAFMAPDPEGPQRRFGELAGNTRLYLLWLAVLWISGPAEELYFRGFMICQLQRALGPGAVATLVSVALPALIFGLGHCYYQGARGLVITGAIGLALGALFIAYQRNLWPLMIAHAAVNSLVFTAQYLELDI